MGALEEQEVSLAGVYVSQAPAPARPSRRKVGVVSNPTAAAAERNVSFEENDTCGREAELRQRSPKKADDSIHFDGESPCGAPSAPPLAEIWAHPPAPGETAEKTRFRREQSRIKAANDMESLYGNLGRDRDSPRKIHESHSIALAPQRHVSWSESEDQEEGEEDEGGCRVTRSGARGEKRGNCGCVGCAGMGDEGGGGCCSCLHRPDGVGPMAKRRKSRDVICMVLFVLCWMFWIVLVWTTVTDGCPRNCNDPRRLVYGTDSRTGEICGFGALAGREKLFFPLPEDPAARRICVSACPHALSDDARVASSLGLVEFRSHAPSGQKQSEEAGASAPVSKHVSADTPSSDQTLLPNCLLMDQRPCFYPTYPTAELLGKCVPVLPGNFTTARLMGFPSNSTAYLLASEFIGSPVGLLGDGVTELAMNWPLVLGFVSSALVAGLVWLLLLQLAATCLVVCLMAVLLLALIAVSLMAWHKAGVIETLLVPHLDESLAAVPVSGATGYIVAIVFSAMTAMMLLLVVFMGRRVLIAVRLIQEAARAVRDIPSVLLVPLTTLPALVILAAWVGVAGLLLLSAGDFDPVLGAYSYGMSTFLRKNDCAGRVLARNPLSTSALHGGMEHAVSHSITRAEAQRLCVVYRDPERAVQAWQLRSSTRLARYLLHNNVTGEDLAKVAISVTTLGSDDDSWASDEVHASNMTLEGWLLGDFRYDLPFTVSDYYQYYWLYHVLLALWTYTFTTTAAVMIIAGAVGHWYFRMEGMAMRGLPVLRSAGRLVCFQLGTLAFGALIVALVWMLRMLVQWAAKKLRQLRDMPFAGTLLCIMQCLMTCLEQFVRYMNRATVIVAAISGKGYCASARKAGSLLMSNVLRVAAVSIASHLVLFFGQVFMCAGATAAAWWWITYEPFAEPSAQAEQLSPKQRPPVVTLMAVAIGSWLLGRVVLGVYWVVIDCVMICFFYDSEGKHPMPSTDVIEGRWRKLRILEEDSDHGAHRNASDSRDKRYV